MTQVQTLYAPRWERICDLTKRIGGLVACYPSPVYRLRAYTPMVMNRDPHLGLLLTSFSCIVHLILGIYCYPINNYLIVSPNFTNELSNIKTQHWNSLVFSTGTYALVHVHAEVGPTHDK